MSENHLIVTSGPGAGRRLDMDDELWIGRETDGPGRLEGDDALDPQHARIARDAQGRLVVEDLGTPGGTAVNGVTIATPHVLQVGDRIEVGNTVLELAGADASAPTGAPVHAPSLRRGSLPASIKGVVFPSVGLLLVQLLTGYLWLASGLTKIWKDGEVYVGGKKEFANLSFVDGFKPFMRDSLVLFEQPVFFTNFIKDVVIENDQLFAKATIVVEVAVGVLLIVAALLWLFAWQKLSHRVRVALLLATIFASLVATGLNLQLWMLYGADIPIAIGEDPFGEAFGLDLYLPVVQIVLGGVALWTLLSLRNARRRASTG